MLLAQPSRKTPPKGWSKKASQGSGHNRSFCVCSCATGSYLVLWRQPYRGFLQRREARDRKCTPEQSKNE
eukprot:3533914-Amphidinium_carterae.1